MVKPRLEDYSVDVLCAIGNQTNNYIFREQVKSIIVNKMLKFDYPMFFLIRMFTNSSLIIKEAYAEVITIKMKDIEYDIDIVIDDIVSMVSLDTLVYYGMESSSVIFKEKCKNEFWKRVFDYEEETGLINGSKIKMIKYRKGD